MTEQGKILKDKLLHYQKKTRPFRLSLRYKLSFPVLVLVILLLSLLFQTTFRTVRALVSERHQSRLQAITEVFAETVKVPLILKNQQILLANIEWMARRPDVQDVRVEDAQGVMMGGGAALDTAGLASQAVEKGFMGVKRISADTYVAAAAIRAREKYIGRVVILFSQKGFEADLRQIFMERLMLAFIMALLLAVLISGITWVAIRPLFNLKRTAQEILAGDLDARARLYSFDEIEDLGEAFNEMVSRLAKSLDNLRSRTEALEESEEKYRLIVESASDIIFMMTPEGEFVLLNKDISGCTREDLMLEGLPLLLNLHSQESRIKFEEAIEKTCETNTAVTNLTVEHLHKISQKPVYYLVNLMPMLDHEGDVKFIQGVMRDVTELRRIEGMKEALIRDVAHELKTPTAKFEMALEWFGKELEKKKEMDKYGQILELMKSNTDRLMRTISSIMDLTKLESGVDKGVMEEFDLQEVLRQVYQDMEPLCQKKGLRLEADFSEAPLHLHGDRDMLYRLFINLISNAVKFTDQGAITLKSESAEDKILVTVRDTGIGLDAEDMKRIFERFYQKTASSVGIGVGLTISRDIAHLHHGRIWAESEGPGAGSIFKVEFPKS